MIPSSLEDPQPQYVKPVLMIQQRTAVSFRIHRNPGTHCDSGAREMEWARREREENGKRAGVEVERCGIKREESRKRGESEREKIRKLHTVSAGSE